MWSRTNNCGELSRANVGQVVTLNGWVQRRRDLGGVLFINLRDRSGMVQVVCNPAFSGAAMEIGSSVRSEYVIAVRGTVVERAPETVNKHIPTGEIEVRVTAIEILNTAKTPPFPIEDGIDVDETIRLKYRYMDLRRPEMQRTLRLRSQVAKIFRDFLDEEGFIEVETPILTKSTPEGARDYLVPSRIYPGEFFALPQSPQIFKQLLMVAGIERYYQIARCFRDEDLRADRQPEFTQVDLETSFLTQDELMALLEKLVARLMKAVKGIDVALPLRRITYADAMLKYGSDKPDLRFGLEIQDITDFARTSGVKFFSSVATSGGVVRALNAKGCAGWSRKEIDELTPYAARYGGKGVAWIAFRDGAWRGSIVKLLTDADKAVLTEALGIEDGDLVLFSADNKKVVEAVLGAIRLLVGKKMNLIDASQFAFAFVVDFPLLGWDPDEKRFVAEHHPFTRPRDEDLPLFETDPGAIRAQAYDLVLNGYEAGGGSMRIYKRDVQEKMFAELGFSMEAANAQFGFLMEALEYGTPPHGGFAFGLDRLVMILAGTSNMRETIAFPKTNNTNDLMSSAPSPVDIAQLQQLHIRTLAKKAAKTE